MTFVVDSEDRGLVNGDILVVHHDGYAVDGPYQLTGAILDYTQYGTVIVGLGSNLKVLDVAVGIGDGNADGLAGVGVCILLHLSHEYALANGRLESLDTGFQRGDTGVQTADQLIDTALRPQILLIRRRSIPGCQRRLRRLHLGRREDPGLGTEGLLQRRLQLPRYR